MPPGAFDRILDSKGGVTNAATSKDFTHYYITIPSKEFDTALELHADMLLNPLIPRKELEKVAEEDADANMEYDLLMKVIEGSTYEIQEADAKAYTDEMMREYQMYAAMYGMDLESYLTQMGKTEEEVRKMYQETAEFRVKLILTLHEIAKVENIEVTEEECQETLKELAAQYGYEGTEEVEAVYGREMVEDQLIQEKVINLIRSNANY